MNRKTAPNPPVDLLARCLATIPETATPKPVALRLFPDAGSRKRLAWLSVAAAVPVLTVLIILPIAHRMERKNAGHDYSKSIASAEPTSFGESIRVYRDKNPYARRASRWYTNRVVAIKTVWHTDKGIYAAIGTVADERNLTGKFTLSHVANLELPDGTIHQRIGNEINTTKHESGRLIGLIEQMSRTLLSPERTTASVGYGRSASSRNGNAKPPPVVVEKRFRGNFSGTSGQPRAVEVVVCLQRPPKNLVKQGAPTIRVHVYRDLKTGLCYAHDAFAFWEVGERKDDLPLLVERAEYRYDKRQDSVALLDPVVFKKAL